jgi:hypothetical protein
LLEGLDSEKNRLVREKWLTEEENRKLTAMLETMQAEILRLSAETSSLRSELEVANCSRDVANTVSL